MIVPVVPSLMFSVKSTTSFTTFFGTRTFADVREPEPYTVYKAISPVTLQSV